MGPSRDWLLIKDPEAPSLRGSNLAWVVGIDFKGIGIDPFRIPGLRT